MSWNDVETSLNEPIAILHYAAPPIIGGVESTIYHHARLLRKAGYPVMVIAGRGEPFHPEVVFHRIPQIDSRHEDVLAIHQNLARGHVPPAFFELRDQLTEILDAILSKVKVCIVHNAMTLHKNLVLTAAIHQLSERNPIRFIGATTLLGKMHFTNQNSTTDIHGTYCAPLGMVFNMLSYPNISGIVWLNCSTFHRLPSKSFTQGWIR